MKLYSQLSKISFLKDRYVAKFLFVAFLGIHIPLIGLVFFVVYLDHQLSSLHIFLITLALTLAATFVTLFVLKNLIEPVLKGSKALIDYRTNGTLPKLPIDFTDEAGLMLKNIQATLKSNEKLVSEKKELFGMLTNDLRTQTLGTVQLVNNIYNESSNVEVRKLSSDAVKSMHQQLQCVDSFIDLLKMETLISKERVRVRKISIQAVLNQTLQQFKGKLEDKNIQISQTIHVNDEYLKVNTKLLQQAFTYLFDNAIKHTTINGKIEVNIERANRRLMIYIKDNGVGFTPANSEKIFTKFNALEFNSEEYTPGIDLYLTRQIIERFGGNIYAESPGINKGAAYTIELKLYKS